MNLTLSIDEHTAAQAQLAAQAMGKSLDQLVREYLEQLADKATLEADISEFIALCGQGDSAGAQFNRESLYAERLARPRGA